MERYELMSTLSSANEIWELKPTEEDLLAGAEYASITLPWTFNRMMMNTGSKGQQQRGLNIAKGIVAQEMLRRALGERGISAEVQRKSHRDDDLFDFRTEIDGKLANLDVKSWNHYTNYSDVGREPFSRELVVENADYAGPDWRYFFPMLVAHTQIKQAKEAYCFCITSSIDFRRDIDTDRVGHALTAFPFGESLVFLSSKSLCLAREAEGKGFYLRCSYTGGGVLTHDALRLTVVGEWDGSPKKVTVELSPGTSVDDVGPFSCVASFQVDRDDYDGFHGRIDVSVSHDDFVKAVRNASMRNINKPPSDPLTLTRNDFCNLVLPTGYAMYVVGWMPKEDFLEKCRNYVGWVWPNDSANRFENQLWTQMTESDVRSVTRAGFADRILSNPRRLRAGWMKTHGRGGGACCYVYPNIGAYGGVKETNLYVLPQDVRIMDELGA